MAIRSHRVRLFQALALGVLLASGPVPAQKAAAAAAGGAEAGAPQQVLAQVLETRGGGARFGRIVEIRRTGTLTVATREGERSLPVRMVIHPPDRVLMETGAEEARLRRVVGPGEAYRVLNGERAPLEDAEARRLARLGQVDEALLARSALSGSVDVKGVEEAGPGQLPPELAGRSARGVRLEDADGRQYLLVVPAEGGLPTRVDYRSTGPDGEERDLSDYFSDWRVVDGLLFPFEVMMFQDQQGFGLLRFDSIEIDLAPEKAGPAS